MSITKDWPTHPAIYEISTWVWLRELGHWLGRPVNLRTVPAKEWDRIAALGFDAVWFMGDYLVDPLALPDLSALAPVFASPEIEKIFHAAEYDLICLHRDFGFDFVSIFDTMQAARVLGYSFVGLDALLAEKFQVKMDKRHQKADWAARPLTPAQIEYARQDTRYLFDLRNLLEQELREIGRLDLARHDFARLCRLEQPREKLNGSTWKRFSGRKDVNPRELTILAELCSRRDAIGRGPLTKREREGRR